MNHSMGVADSLSDNFGHELPDLCLCCMLHNVFERRGGGNVICFMRSAFDLISLMGHELTGDRIRYFIDVRLALIY